MNKQQKKDKGWEERFRQLYEGANCEGGCISSRMCDFFIGFISTELQKQYHDYEILVNTILETKNKEIQEAERRAYVKGYCDARNRYKERERLIKLLNK